MHNLNIIYSRNSYKYILSVIIILNTLLLYSLKVPTFDLILNLLISYGIFIYHNNIQLKLDKNINIFQLGLATSLLFFTLYRSFWLHIEDNFVYLFLPLLLISTSLFFINFSKIINNLYPLFIALLFPVGKVLFIPLAILINPISTLTTWLLLNAFGFYSVLDGQEIFYNSFGISVTFSCSGAGQIIFCLTAMIILNFLFPLKNNKIFFVQLYRSFLITFSINILRLCILTIYSNTANSIDFSVFDYLHGGNGGLFFSFISMLISCESYKRLYLNNT